MTPFYGPPCIMLHGVNGESFDTQSVGHRLLLSM